MLQLSAVGKPDLPSVGRTVNRTSPELAHRIIRVLQESAGGHGVEAGLNLGAVHHPVKVPPPEAICPECGARARRESLEMWSAEEGWRIVERSVCLNRPRKGGAPGERCGKVTVMSEKSLSRKAPETIVNTTVAAAVASGHVNGGKHDAVNGTAVNSHSRGMVRPVASKSSRRYSEDEMAALRRRVLDEGHELYTACDELGIPRAAGHTIVYWERMRREGKSLQRPRKGSDGGVADAIPLPSKTVATMSGLEAQEAEEGPISLESILSQLGSLDLKTFLSLPEQSRAAIQHLLQAHG